MDGQTRIGKRKPSSQSEHHKPKRSKNKEDVDPETEYRAGKVRKIFMRNFMCHEALEVNLNQNVNFIVGRNGSGKSAILAALTVGLGARAHITSRGASVKEFIKKGKTSASIEITLVNQGSMAYKPEVYGDTIIVIRTIGSSSTYKIKNWKGTVISSKRNELDNILHTMNIQIDNPVSILNQDISRTFLTSSKPEEKYNLFMKATLLDVIGNNYKEAEKICCEEYDKIKQYNEILADARKEVELLKETIKKIEGINKLREQVVYLEKELCWGAAIAEEMKLQRIEEDFKKYNDKLQLLQEAQSSVGIKEEQIDKKTAELQAQIRNAEQEVDNSSEAYNKVKEEYSKNKDVYMTKESEWQSIQGKIKRLEKDVTLLREEVHRLENGNNKEQLERNQLKQQLLDAEQKLDEAEAMLRTKQTDQMHLEADKMRLLKDMQSSKIEVNSSDARIYEIRRDLTALKRQSDNALTIYGPNIPRFLKRIEEEYRNQRFMQKPRGPLGAYITLKDPAWAPAIENFFGAGTFSTFCVDNSHDAKVLNEIMKEIFLNETRPSVICSKFFNKVHDVRKYCIQEPGYSSLLDAMLISDPVVANCLIDQHEVECVLLLRTSKEAYGLMLEASKVPRNCKLAITQQGDTFYPDPDYRSYSGRRGMKAKFLQVSTADAIKALEEELHIAENERKSISNAYTILCKKEQQTSSELTANNEKIAKLRIAQNRYKALIDDMKDKIDASEALCITLFRNELIELEKKLQQEKAEEKSIGETVLELKKNVESLETEVKRYRDLRLTLDIRITPLQKEIRELCNEKDALHRRAVYAMRQLETARQAVQNATAELMMQQRVTNKVVSDAANRCERIETERSVNEIERLIRDLKGQIYEIERQFGSLESLQEKLKEKETKCGNEMEFATTLEKSYEKHRVRLAERRQMYRGMKKLYARAIQNSFSNVLLLRNYKGIVHIDHVNKILTLEVSPQNDGNTATKSTSSLSGGERSYSTIAFILALWDCTNLPFYFLDEFDVFMDKLNRRVIMDILLDHAKIHPQSQFTLLTPLDTSNVFADDYVTIHQLAPPERS
ncbi:hypothetical protein KM043_011277 [Ampulex compressa]|nr:hypothetical protein KM043_011277 [Ampulex compressa]